MPILLAEYCAQMHFKMCKYHIYSRSATCLLSMLLMTLNQQIILPYGMDAASHRQRLHQILWLKDKRFPTTICIYWQVRAGGMQSEIF